MRRVAVIIGSCEEVGGPVTLPRPLPKSDRATIGLAIKRFGGQVDAYCLGDDEDALRYALAAGAATATRLDDVSAIDFDVVLIGSGGAGPWGDLLPALLAERKQCAMVFDVLDVDPSPGGITVRRDLGHGSREVLSLSGPAVLSIAENAEQLLYVSHYRRQAVRVALPAPSAGPALDPLLAVSGPWEPVRPRVKTGSLAAKTGGSASARMQALLGMTAGADRENVRAHVIVADAATCARHLLRFLSHHGIIATSGMAPAECVSTEEDAESSRQRAGTTIRPQSVRGPRLLEGDGRGIERGPRPLETGVVPSRQTRIEKRTRGPRPVGQAVSQRGRGPRSVDSKP
jgi:hypothetical protein